jgi:enoyl-CoA hydratase/carnithine racemase
VTNDAIGRLRIEVHGAVGSIVFDNPTRRNAVTLEMWEELTPAIDRFSDDPEIRVVTLRGAGDAAFVSGADISEFKSKRSTGIDRDRYDRATNVAQQRLYELMKPTVAVVRGYCVGAGVALAACCDVRIASSGARFSVPAAKLGLGYRAAVIRKLMDLLGPSRVLDIFYTAELFDARHAQSIGLVEHVVSEEDLDFFVSDYCGRVCANAPLTLIAAKTVVREISRLSDQYNSVLCDQLVRRCFEIDDFLVALEAFERRERPHFKGR